ncbi:hypothetical protein MEO40_23995 [Dolichospermum sp. ST_sed1]|nr:hypothetical protein [Dolichospermum sp. ST_sed1]MDD1429113.1 hypothetical protein [Dolichospermum sp. ST_sed9]MDD1443497.1 hypothetical protein [Dolichospermum sp. ST_sed3]MDD1449110.1 hypothetical protein [Dolichospermum sp. ST_sed8]MDD1457749.1 hypothetical protein [Dolichospermum sp. ST_sed7]MDD1463130.1 hypothetical protein [Dolichospermum sp. ST_sed2]MDD1474310.1 hypothetical protein [Dolichospermum sp. ST_sed4]
MRWLFGKLEGVRSLFGRLKGCDRCLGSWRGAIAVWGVEGCDRSFSVSSVSLWFVKKGYWGVQGVRSLFVRLRGAIAVWEVEGVRSLFGS